MLLLYLHENVISEMLAYQYYKFTKAVYNTPSTYFTPYLIQDYMFILWLIKKVKRKHMRSTSFPFCVYVCGIMSVVVMARIRQYLRYGFILNIHTLL